VKILVLGGTQFVGRHIVEALARVEHSVSTLNRGRSADELPPQVERLRGDRDQGSAGLYALERRSWDVCVDVNGYTAQQVRASTQMLRESVGRYVFVSAVSVYGDPARGPVAETEPRSTPAREDVIDVTAATYGPLKVTCENIVVETFGARCALVRPQIIAGPHDPIDRLSYWVRRAAQGGEMLAPGDGSDHVQFIDARDVARLHSNCVRERAGRLFQPLGAQAKLGRLHCDACGTEDCVGSGTNHQGRRHHGVRASSLQTEWWSAQQPDARQQ